jgi:hypothetical protein
MSESESQSILPALEALKLERGAAYSLRLSKVTNIDIIKEIAAWAQENGIRVLLLGPDANVKRDGVICADCKHFLAPYWRGPLEARCAATRVDYVHSGMISFANCKSVNCAGDCPKFEAKPVEPPKRSKFQRLVDWLFGWNSVMRESVMPRVSMDIPVPTYEPPRPWKQPPPPPKCTCKLDPTICEYHTKYEPELDRLARGGIPHQPVASGLPRSAPPRGGSGVPSTDPHDRDVR